MRESGLSINIAGVRRFEELSALYDSLKSFVRYELWKTRHIRVNPAIKQLRHRLRYGRAAPKRYRLIEIDPGSVDYLLSPHFWNRVSKYSTHIKDGNWDQNRSDREVKLYGRCEGINEPTLIRFENYQLYESAKNHFFRDVPWEETELYRWLMDEWLPANPDTYERWYDSADSIRAILEEFDELYHHIRKNGYLTQKEIHTEGSSPFTSPGHSPDHHEVAINIGRDGGIIFDDGRHRFIVAKLLGLEAIPVRVLVRHSEWQAVRNEVRTAASVSELRSQTREHLEHPDLKDVRSQELAVP